MENYNLLVSLNLIKKWEWAEVSVLLRGRPVLKCDPVEGWGDRER